MQRYSPKRSSRLINVVSEWSKNIESEINQEDEFKFIFAFFLRDPFDDKLHICLDGNKKSINTDKEIRKQWDARLDENELKKFLDYIQTERNDRYLEIIENELSDNAGEEFTTSLLALLHSFPYPMTQKTEGKPKVYSCVDDRLYYRELFDNETISRFVNVKVLPKAGHLPDFKIENESVVYSQDPTKIAKNKIHKEALNTFLKIFSFVSKLPLFIKNDYPGFLMPIRNGKNNNEGSILGFVNFGCNNFRSRNKIRKFLSQKLELIHLQVNDAFFEGTLFEIEHGLEKIVEEPLFKLAESNLQKIFFGKEFTKKIKPLNLTVDYKTDIPYELRRTISPLKEFEDVGENPITQCVCQFVGNACREGCEDYQKGKIIELIIRLAQIKQNQQEIQKETVKHGTKAALSAIIVRNHSHHVGSNVMPRATVKKIREMVIGFDVPEMISNGEEIWHMTEKYETKDVFKREEYFGKLSEFCCFDKRKKITDACEIAGIKDTKIFTNKLIEAAQKGNVLKDTNEIVGVLKDKLDEYIQKKADFTAEIATEPLTSTKNMSFFDEVILNFVVNTPLMGNIGANEDVRYRSFSNNRLKIYFSVNGKPLTGYYKATNCFKGERYSHTELPYAMHCSCDLELAIDTTDNKDVTIALPGCLGEYAIYAFLENFIRNGIKHNKSWLDKWEKENYEIYINVSELKEADPNFHYKDEFYKVAIHDNVEIVTDKKFSITKDNGVKNVGLPEFLQHLISKPIVNDDGSLRKEALGIAEMKIMATLLRGSTDFTNMSKNLTVMKDENGYLDYKFYVMKPKKVAIISNLENIKRKEGQKEHGIWWFNSLGDYKNHILKGESTASFKFVVIDEIVDDTSAEKYFKELTPTLPFRVLINNNIDNCICKKITRGFKTIESEIIESIKAIKNSDCSKILEITWKVWMDKFIEGKNLTKDSLTLSLFFQQKGDENPTQSWSVGTCTTPPARKSILTNAEITDEIYREDYKGKKILMYDRHFVAFNQLNNKATKKGDTINLEFHEAFDKNSSDFVHIHSLYHYERNYELVEAALLKVLIIDERIAEVAHCNLNIDDGYAQTAYGSKKRLLVAKKAGISLY